MPLLLALRFWEPAAGGAPTPLTLRLNTREGTFVWPEDSFEAVRRDQAITRVEAEKV